MIGLALSATTYVVVLGAVAQIIPAARQSRVFGIVTATGSSGMFVVPPLAQFLLSNFGWQTALMALAGVVALIMLIAFGLPGGTGRPSGQPNAPAVDEPIGQVLTKARRHSGYLLLTTGFFVCGFHVAFISTHLPAFLADREMPAFVGAAVLSLIGAFNIVGSVTFGWLGDQYPRKYLLSLIYFGRALVIALFLIFPLSQSSALIFGSAMGFLWLATVPLTSGMVARLFGTRYLSTLYGIVFLSHQLGAFLGVWLGGRLYDTLGSYNPVWYIAIALGLIAAVIHIPLSEKPAVQVQIA
jgi:predicted MFS family arabinose efflux permease